MTDPILPLREELDRIGGKGLLRSMHRIDGMQGPIVKMDGRDVILMCSNNYLGLAGRTELIEAAVSAAQKYGVGSAASRLISGDMALHERLEHDIAGFKKTESALVFNSGYHANIGIISAIADGDTAVLSDSLNHASIIDGVRLARARTFVYEHRDVGMVEDMLGSMEGKGPGFRPSRKLIVTDSVFSMDGDIAPLREIAGLARKYNAILMVDEAHATGILGEHGRGAVEMFGLDDGVHVQMGTLGKAFGSFGAYAAGTKLLTDYLVNRARSFIFTTSLPPAVCAVSSKAIELVRQHPELRKALGDNIAFMRKGLRDIGFDVSDDPTPIIPLIIGDAERTMQFSSSLLGKGVFVSGIRPPTVPEGTSRLRLTVTAAHTREMLGKVLDVIRGMA
ncbi:MAG: 8-amino-7-oxononanoate synthase [Deltaproteobacteria bacterium]|nr:8-amino-7-oxononanoate synthase [Deltaproteobacteria bacterium]MCL5277582.1 8-amino-7-oxononanoate synthase [Deltaproteobacteria bacterium]